MDETGLVMADDLGQMGEKGDDIMFGDGLDLIDPGDIERHIPRFPDRFGIGLWDHAQFGLGITGMGLDLVPDAEFCFR